MFSLSETGSFIAERLEENEARVGTICNDGISIALLHSRMRQLVCRASLKMAITGLFPSELLSSECIFRAGDEVCLRLL